MFSKEKMENFEIRLEGEEPTTPATEEPAKEEGSSENSEETN